MKQIEQFIEAPVDYQLSEAESTELTNLETTIERGLRVFWEVGNALLTIRDKRLYRASHGTFETYCIERWGFTDEQARRLMRSSEVVANLQQTPPIGGVLPGNESQVRPLTKLKDPSQQRQAWQKAVESAPDGKPTGAGVAKAVEEVKQPTQPNSVDAQVAAHGESLGVPRSGDSVLPESDRIDELTHSSPADDKPGVLPNGAIATAVEVMPSEVLTDDASAVPTPAQKAAVQQELAGLLETLEANRDEIEYLKLENSNLQEKVEHLTSENVSLRQKKDALALDELTSLKAELEASQATIAKLKRERNALEKDADDFQQMAGEVLLEKESLEEQIEQLCGELEILRLKLPATAPTPKGNASTLAPAAASTPAEKSKPKGITQAALAARLGVNSTTIMRHKHSDIVAWSKGKEPNGVAWRYSKNDELFYPVEKQ